MDWLKRLCLFVVVGVAIAVGIGAAPAGWFLLWQTYPGTWVQELARYQALAGALIALNAASIGMIGVLLTIRTQRLNVERQLAAQRREQDRARELARKQVAAAFIGEIATVIQELRHEWVRPALVSAVSQMQSGMGPRAVTTVRIGGEFARYYNSDPGNVGLFPNPIPENLTRFYSRFEAIKLELDRYSDLTEGIWRTLSSQAAVAPIPQMTTDQVIRLLRSVLENIDTCLQLGPALTRELEAIRDTGIN